MGRKVGGWLRRGAIGTIRLPDRAIRSGIRQTGIPGGIQQAWRDRRSWWLGGSESKEAREKRDAMNAGLLGGGLAGREAARQGVIRKRVQEAVERNKKLGRTDQEIQSDLNAPGDSDASIIKRRSAALTMADRESFSSAGEFAKAIEAVGSDMESVSKIIRKAPKEIMKNGKDFADALEAVGKSGKLSPSALAQAQNQLIEKASGGALAGESGDIGRILGAFKGENKEDLEKVLKARMKKEGKIKSLIEYNLKQRESELASADDTKKAQIHFEEYEKVLKDYNAENLGSQAKLMDDDNFRKYFKQKVANGDYKARFQSDYLRRAEGDRKTFEEFIRGRRMTEEEEIIAGGGTP